jgi:hypothetical protein
MSSVPQSNSNVECRKEDWKPKSSNGYRGMDRRTKWQ